MHNTSRLSFNRNDLVSQAFEKTISVLDKRAARDLVEELRRSGADTSSLTLESLAVGLRAVLGNEASDIIIEDVIIKLDEMCSLAT